MVNRFSMIFNVKSINTVDNAGKQVDGMKRPREPPTGGNRMDMRTNIADRGSSNPQCITAIREGSNAAGKTPDRNGGADVLNLDVSHFGKTACRLFRKEHRKRD
jgi:hypothetical protein